MFGVNVVFFNFILWFIPIFGDVVFAVVCVVIVVVLCNGKTGDGIGLNVLFDGVFSKALFVKIVWFWCVFGVNMGCVVLFNDFCSNGMSGDVVFAASGLSSVVAFFVNIEWFAVVFIVLCDGKNGGCVGKFSAVVFGDFVDGMVVFVGFIVWECLFCFGGVVLTGNVKFFCNAILTDNVFGADCGFTTSADFGSVDLDRDGVEFLDCPEFDVADGFDWPDDADDFVADDCVFSVDPDVVLDDDVSVGVVDDPDFDESICS